MLKTSIKVESEPGGSVRVTKIMKNCQGWFQEFSTIKSRPEIVEPSGFDPQMWNFTKSNVKMMVLCCNEYYSHKIQKTSSNHHLELPQSANHHWELRQSANHHWQLPQNANHNWQLPQAEVMSNVNPKHFRQLKSQIFAPASLEPKCVEKLPSVEWCQT